VRHAVHRAEQREAEPGELALRGGDRGVDGVAPGRLAERVTEHLDVPLRDRNTLLLAGGYAPAYPVGNFLIAIRPSGCSLSPSRRSCSCHPRMCSG
jgi:hypothetical protein